MHNARNVSQMCMPSAFTSLPFEVAAGGALMATGVSAQLARAQSSGRRQGHPTHSSSDLSNVHVLSGGAFCIQSIGSANIRKALACACCAAPGALPKLVKHVPRDTDADAAMAGY